jgi:hypothetical protein
MIAFAYGPMPAAAPVAPEGFKASGQAWSCGYDAPIRYDAENKPGQKVLTRIAWSNGDQFYTEEKPWHGRSGGGLIDIPSGKLIGVCEAYTGRGASSRESVMNDPNRKGVYHSAARIRGYLRSKGMAWVFGEGTEPPSAPQKQGIPHVVPQCLPGRG